MEISGLSVVLLPEELPAQCGKQQACLLTPFQGEPGTRGDTQRSGDGMGPEMPGHTPRASGASSLLLSVCPGLCPSPGSVLGAGSALPTTARDAGPSQPSLIPLWSGGGKASSMVAFYTGSHRSGSDVSASRGPFYMWETEAQRDEVKTPGTAA